MDELAADELAFYAGLMLVIVLVFTMGAVVGVAVAGRRRVASQKLEPPPPDRAQPGGES